MTDIKKKIAEVAEKDKSKWLEKAKYRRENRDWLLKSKRIALRVLGVLKERGMQQKELAKELGVSPQQVSKIVKGKENLTLETISKLEAVLGISLFELPKSQPKETKKVDSSHAFDELYNKLLKEVVTHKDLKSGFLFETINFKYSWDDLINVESVFDFKKIDSKKSVVKDIDNEEWRKPDKPKSNLRLVG